MIKGKLKVDTSELPGKLVELIDEGAESPHFVDGFNTARELMWLGARIRNLRCKAKMTQQALAQHCNMNQVDISRIEAGLGKQGPTYVTLLKLSRALKDDLVSHSAVRDASEKVGAYDMAPKG